jgi:hypothetical protein
MDDQRLNHDSTAGFCDQCKQHGHEARTYSQWTPYKEPQQ